MADTRMQIFVLVAVFGTVVSTTCRGEGQKEEIIVDREGLKSLEPFLRLNPERMPDIPSRLHEKAIPTWTYAMDIDLSRTPSDIKYANCSSSRCKRGYKVHPVYAPQIVACAFTDEDGMRKYSVQKQQFAVACICVRSNVGQRRGRKKKEERGVLSTRTRRPRRRGRGRRRHAPGGTE